MSNPHSVEVKEDKREWWISEKTDHCDPYVYYSKPNFVKTTDPDECDCEPEIHHVVPASEKQRLQTLLDEAVTLLGDYRNVCGIKQRDKLREFLERVKK